MKKKIAFSAIHSTWLNAFLLLSVFIIGSQSIKAQTIDFGRSVTQTKVTEDNFKRTKVSYTYSGLESFGVETKSGVFSELMLPGAYAIGALGTPKLPASKDLIEIPFGAEVSVKVLSSSVSEYKLSDFGIDNYVMPTQPSLRKDQSIEDVKFEYQEDLYKKDGFISHELATIEVLGVMRSYRIARLTIAPVSYNPVEGVIRVHNDIEVEITYTNVDETLTDYVKSSTYSPYFDVIKKSLLNGNTRDYPQHPDLTKYPVKYLIVSDRMFEEELQAFIEWKTKKGFYVTIAYTDEIGSTYNQIKDWVHAQYNAGTPEDPAPSFLLLVGDTPQIPATQGSSSYKMTDLYYASVDGDMFPEMYYGRFSATNVQHLISQVEKTLYYEQYQFVDPSYLNKVTLIAGADSYWNPAIGQATVNYGTQNYYNTANGFTDIYTYLTSPYTGCYGPERIAVGFINYSAHCMETMWGDPALSISAVNAFTNENFYPLAVGNCCLAADFGYGECIGEAWMRANKKGSVAYLGSSPSSYWFEDFYWSVGAFPVQGNNNGYVPTFEETSLGAYDAPFVSDYVSTGGNIAVGNLAVTEVHIQGYPNHSSPLYYWQAYNVLGDPSLVIYHTEGSENEVSHMPILPIGLDVYEVTALAGSYVAISKDGVLHGAALVGPEGVVEVPIEPILSSGQVDIVVTKPQYIPYSVQVPAAALEGPYVVLDSYEINDQSGNNNGLADYSETINLHITLKNVGADPSAAITATVSNTDPYVSLNSAATQNFPAIANGASTTLQNAYTFNIADFVPDQHTATFKMTITDGSDSWESNLRITVQAPVLVIDSEVFVMDNVSGNGDGILDPGETADLKVTIKNTGHSDVTNLVLNMVSSDPLLVVNSATVNHSQLGASQNAEILFNVTAAENAPVGHPVNVTTSLTAGPSGVYTAQQTSMVVIGLIPDYFMTNGSATTCVGTFYDSGGPNGNYGNNENFVFTFYPTSSGSMIRAEFVQFDLESNYDKMWVYNGENENAPMIDGSPFSGTTSPGTIMGLNAEGALTFKFTSDVSVNKAGWIANITCHTPTGPPECATNPSPADGATNISLSSALSWYSDDANTFDLYFGHTPEPPFIETLDVNQYNPVLEPNTTYFWKVEPKNMFGAANGCELWSFTTGGPEYLMSNTVVSVNNGMFYDSGGPDANYDNNESYTMIFLPVVEGAPLKFNFTSFEIENNYDKLYVYNGPDVNAPEFQGSPFTGTTSPGTLTSSHPSGAITFRFTSDYSVNRPGWIADFIMLSDLTIDPVAMPDAICEGSSALLKSNVSGGSGNYTFSWTPADGLNDPTAANPIASPTVTTTYQLTVNDGTNQVSGSVTLQVYELIPVDLGGDKTICNFETVVLDATTANAVSYLWLPSGETTPTYTFDGVEMGVGIHTVSVEVTDANGCVATDEIQITVEVCPFIEENQIHLQIHPNPASSTVNIQLTGNSSRVSYELLNYQGKQIYKSKELYINGVHHHQLDVSTYAKGIYYLRLNSNLGTSVKKIVVK